MRSTSLLNRGISLVFFALLNFALFAQETPDKGHRPPPPPGGADMEQRMEAEQSSMAKEVGLSAEQQAQIKKMDAEYKAKHKAEKQQRKEDHEKARQERIAAYKSVMTPEQSAKYDQWLQKRDAERMAKHEDHMKQKAEKKADKKAWKKGQKDKTAPVQDGGQKN